MVEVGERGVRRFRVCEEWDKVGWGVADAACAAREERTETAAGDHSWVR
jgi:hypothetical protein